MRRIECYDEISALLRPWLRRGVLTNNFLTAADYRAGVGGGTLFVDRHEGGLFFFRRREDFWQVHFHLQADPQIWPEVIFPAFSVAEAAARDKLPGAASGFLRARGLHTCLIRKRMTAVAVGGARADEGTDGIIVQTATETDAEAVNALLRAHFNRYTGCLPTWEELEADIRERLVFVCQRDGQTAGVLRMGARAGYTEILHLAVAEAFRRQGVGRAMVEACHRAYPGFTGRCPFMKKGRWRRRDGPSQFRITG